MILSDTFNLCRLFLPPPPFLLSFTPSSPSSSSFPLTLTHTGSSCCKYLPFRKKKTPHSAGYQSKASSLPLPTLAELKIIPVYLRAAIWEVLQVPRGSLSYLLLQTKTSFWFRASLWIRKCWCCAAAADEMDQEDPRQVWVQPAVVVSIQVWLLPHSQIASLRFAAWNTLPLKMFYGFTVVFSGVHTNRQVNL